jgi:DNA integrity scanning protein DisA with diadenylate cyclase activity
MFLVDARGLNKIQGRPFLVSEIEEAIERLLAEKSGTCITLEVDNLMDEFVDGEETPE